MCIIHPSYENTCMYACIHPSIHPFLRLQKSIACRLICMLQPSMHPPIHLSTHTHYQGSSYSSVSTASRARRRLTAPFSMTTVARSPSRKADFAFAGSTTSSSSGIHTQVPDSKNVAMVVFLGHYYTNSGKKTPPGVSQVSQSCKSLFVVCSFDQP